MSISDARVQAGWMRGGQITLRPVIVEFYSHFGGSTACRLFRPDVIDWFAVDAIPQFDNPEVPQVLVHAELAAVTPTSRKAS